TEIVDEPDSSGRPLPVLHARSAGLRGPYLLLVGHLDTVLPAAPPELRDGRLWASGAVDMKGGLAALVGAMAQLRHQGRQPPEDLRLVVVPDEEVAGRISHRAMAELGGEARALWVLEPGEIRDPGEAGGRITETLVIGRRGMIRWQLDVHGRSAHAGNGFWQGRSALVAAARFCVGAHGLSRPGPGPTVNPARIVAGERGFVEQLQEHADLLFTPRQVNVVPDRARAEGEARYLDPADGEALNRALGELAAGLDEPYGVRTELAISEEIRPLPAEAASRRWAELAGSLAAERGWLIEAQEDRRGISFPNFLPAALEIPVLDGLGPAGGGLHTREEFVDLASLDRRIVLLADLLAASRTSANPA
ncbi:MAG: M20/M25/M40 family metallo-hydrolase, partial [Holophagales bacterium]|nr:M20/M25/M40 family metallo-hydrolase [Holophagales bacterium]